MRRVGYAALLALLLLTGCGGSDGGGRGRVTPAVVGTTSAVIAVVDAANAFLGKLDADEKAKVLLSLSKANATAWSDLPCGSTCRVGIELGTLSEDQLAAARDVLRAALGTRAGVGYDQVMKILQADDVLGSAEASGGDPAADASGAPARRAPSRAPDGGGHSSGTYFLAVLGSPSMDGTWQLHFGGHHLAVNITYKAGQVAGATPYFAGIEPASWTTDDGTQYAPLDAMRDGMRKLTGSLRAAQLAKARLTGSFTDVLLGPARDGRFPKTKRGLKVSELSAEQRTLVLEAIRPWVAVVDNATAASLMRAYESELDQTYVGYSGDTGLTAHGDYVRIDGPGAWVEFVCQNGVVHRDRIRYHTVYRDHSRDYGGEFTF